MVMFNNANILKSKTTAIIVSTLVAATMMIASSIHLAYADYDEEKSDKKYTKQADCGTYDGSDKGLEKLQKTLDKLFEKEEKRGLDRTLNCLD